MNTLLCSPRGVPVLMSISFDACSALISIGSQPFAQVLLCTGALLLKNIGNKDDPHCWMRNTIPMGE